MRAGWAAAGSIKGARYALSTTSRSETSARASLRKGLRSARECPREIVPVYAGRERSTSRGKGSVVLPFEVVGPEGAVTGGEKDWESATCGSGLVVAIDARSGSLASLVPPAFVPAAFVIVGCPPAGTVSFDKEMAPLISSHKRRIAAGSHEEE